MAKAAFLTHSREVRTVTKWNRTLALRIKIEDVSIVVDITTIVMRRLENLTRRQGVSKKIENGLSIETRSFVISLALRIGGVERHR